MFLLELIMQYKGVMFYFNTNMSLSLESYFPHNSPEQFSFSSNFLGNISLIPGLLFTYRYTEEKTFEPTQYRKCFASGQANVYYSCSVIWPWRIFS